MAKLTVHQIEKIIKDPRTPTEIAKDYGVHRTTIARIFDGEIGKRSVAILTEIKKSEIDYSDWDSTPFSEGATSWSSHMEASVVAAGLSQVDEDITFVVADNPIEYNSYVITFREDDEIMYVIFVPEE